MLFIAVFCQVKRGFPAKYFLYSKLSSFSNWSYSLSEVCSRGIGHLMKNMPKPPQYSQKFRDSWLQDPALKDWLQMIESTTGQVAKCKFCGTTLRSHYGDLKSHGMSKKHQQNAKVS